MDADDHDVHMSSGDEGDQPARGDQARDQAGPRRRLRPGRHAFMMPLDLLQVLAGGRLEYREPEVAANDTGLVDALRKNGMLTR